MIHVNLILMYWCVPLHNLYISVAIYILTTTSILNIIVDVIFVDWKLNGDFHCLIPCIASLTNSGAYFMPS
jgi:hypothetical protein